jgi:CHAD domain-containing protein
MKTLKQSFIIPESIPIARLSHLIARDHPVKADPPARRSLSYYDSFDWRLFRKGLFLVREVNRYQLGHIDENGIIAEAGVTTGARPQMWQDFPPGELQERLQSLLSLRALLHLMHVENVGQTLHLQNSGGHPVVRIDLNRTLLRRNREHTDLGQQIVLQADSNHIESWRLVRHYLKRQGVTQPAGDLYRKALTAAGLKPRTTSKKLDFCLQPEMPSGQAATIIMRSLLNTMKRNEAGLKADIDTEFLHDYRVACRRARSLVGQLASVFPPAVAEDLQRDLTQLGSLSNRLRDLDVYLLKEAEYRLMLTRPMLEGLNVLFRSLARERRREHARVVQAMADQASVANFARWRDLFTVDCSWGPQAGKHTASPIRQLARRRIRKRARSLLKAGDAIGDSSTDSHLHRMRIQGKKLRYLLEFFASLFPPAKTAHLIKQLKLLQDNLGDFNDLAVQQRELAGYLARCRSLEGDPIITAAAIGALITQLQRKQMRIRGEFARTYGRFACSRNRRLFGKLFG